ncbi:hypothetical protein [Fibrobacter sp.]|uniref:hypothetical protein n=1 Tax=Fibrobacter sp. TaxID=35828 RepID=UPI00388FDFC2
MEYIALALSLIAVILCIVILTKVNKLLTMLRTPIFKKLTPDMNLKPGSRRPISAQEMAQRGEKGNKENRQNNGKDRPAKENRDNRASQQNPSRNEQRENRGNRRDRREGRPERPRREMNVEAQAAPAAVEAQAPAAAPVAEAPAAEARRPLAPRIPVETPAAPAAAPVAAPVAPVAEAPVEAVETTFDPSKVRYGRRNVIKKAPELADED